MMSNKNELSTKITEVVTELNTLKTEIGTSESTVNSELDELTGILSLLTLTVTNMDNITESRIKTCGNITGANGGTTQYDCDKTSSIMTLLLYVVKLIVMKRYAVHNQKN